MRGRSRSIIPQDAAQVTCQFLCGAIQGVTGDPVDSARRSIRWANESSIPDDPPNPKMPRASCFYCNDAWRTEVAGQTAHRDRATFCQEAARDSDVRDKMKAPRDNIAAKLKAKKQADNKRGPPAPAQIDYPANLASLLPYPPLSSFLFLLLLLPCPCTFPLM